jgi:cyclopropane-fatty-acyl-phospholipid synthase
MKAETFNGLIYQGRVMHARLEPVKHAFEYPVYWYAFDLDQLSTLAKANPLFGYNQFKPVSIYDKDYFVAGPGTIRQKLITFLRRAGITEEIGKVQLITSARYFGYVFNPVSFYYCYNIDGSLLCNIAEVNNTFHERHLYILDYKREPRRGFLSHYTVDKAFHVSPFNDLKGEYDFHFSSVSKDVDIRIDILREGKAVFVSRLWGDSVALTTGTLLKTLVRFPLTVLWTVPRIYWQAARLHYQRKLPVITKPNPSSPWTIVVAPPTRWERFCMRYVLNWISSIDRGVIEITFPDGRVKSYGKANGELPARMQLKNYGIFPRLLRDGGIGLGESFQAGDWETDNLAVVVYRFLDNSNHLPESKLNLLKPFRWLLRLEHTLRKNSLKNSVGNISAHYDLSNDFFQLFLDPSLTYSSAVFRTPADTLQEAQANKVSVMIEKAHIPQGGSLLEIGSGWGALAIEAVKKHNCKVTSISLSQEQLALARERSQKAGLNEKIEFRFEDYRKTQGTFDSIVSVEMMEAVGHQYLGDFFAAIDRLLKPNGVAVLQVIAFPDYEYNDYLTRQDWIQRHIFPGSHLPSLQAMIGAVSKHTKLLVESVENIGPHYATTLREWHRRFNQRLDEIRGLGFDEHFIRTWQFYFASCEAEFASRWLNVYQIVLTRPNNQVLVKRDADFRDLIVAPVMRLGGK